MRNRSKNLEINRMTNYIMNCINRIRKPSFDAVYHIYKYADCKNGLVRFYHKQYLIKKYGVFLPNNIKVGQNLKLPHPNGIILGNNVQIGNNVTIYQHVTIGGKNIGDTSNGKIAKIGNNVVLFSGAKILGDITIGDNSQIGANAVLLVSTEENSVYAGVPAKRIGYIG